MRQTTLFPELKKFSSVFIKTLIKQNNKTPDTAVELELTFQE